jgi:putative phage-type endonuclease
MQPAQRTEEWFEARLGRVTASKVADALNYMANGRESAARKKYREEIVAERLTGQRADLDRFVTNDMKWGIANEAIAKNVYQITTRRIIEDSPFVQHPKLMAGASPDGYIGEDGLVEIKCLRSANHLYKAMKTQEVPPEHIPQIQMQLWITGRKYCDFISFDSRLPEGLRIFVQRVDRDEDYIKNLEAEVKKFLAECDRDFKMFWAMVKGSATETGKP